MPSSNTVSKPSLLNTVVDSIYFLGGVGVSVKACTTGQKTRGSLSTGSLSRGSLSKSLCLGVSIWGSLSRGSLSKGPLSRGLCYGSLSGESLSRGSLSGSFCPEGLYLGFSVQGGLCQWDLYPGGLCPGVSLSRGSLSRGVSVQGGLCLWDLCLGVSVRETPEYGNKWVECIVVVPKYYVSPNPMKLVRSWGVRSL